MILILLIAAAAACVVAGVLSGSLMLAYVALGLAVLGALVFGVDAWRKRAAPAPAASAESEEPAESPMEVVAGTEFAEEQGRVPAVAVGRNGHGPYSTEEPVSVAGAESDSARAVSTVTTEEPVLHNGTVYALPGRKRFHHLGCRVLDGHSSEELTVADAEDEGFSMCSLCASGAR